MTWSVCVCVCVCVCVHMLSCVQPFVTLWTGACLSGFSVHGIFQARILECVDFSYSKHLPHPGIETVSCNGRWILHHCATWAESSVFNVWMPLWHFTFVQSLNSPHTLVTLLPMLLSGGRQRMSPPTLPSLRSSNHCHWVCLYRASLASSLTKENRLFLCMWMRSFVFLALLEL